LTPRPPELSAPELLRGQALIGGRWLDGNDGTRYPVFNPADGSLVARVAVMGVARTREAIEAAQQALPAWSARPAQERAHALMRWHDLITAHATDLALLMTTEQGKPLAESLGEVAYAASFIQWFAQEGMRVYGDTIPSPWPDRRLLVLRQPVGVCAAITPWNFPLAMITRKAAPALAAGCTMVLKPAEATPLSALALGHLAIQAGLPPGVLNVIPSPRDQAERIGRELCENPAVRKLSFTGSTQVGRVLLRQCADSIKKVSLELGGNAPFIVFDDADVDAAVDGAIAAKYRNAGQTCTSANRFYVQAGIHDEFVKRLSRRTAQLAVGPGDEEGNDVGPLISLAAIRNVQSHVQDALRHGARVMCGGAVHAAGPLFHEPTVIVGASSAMRLAREEILGPIAAVFRFSDEAEAVAQANHTEYGLASYFYTTNLARAWRVAEALESGMVAVNSGVLSTAVAPFGGVKQSGIGREGSKYGIDEYLETKYVAMGGLA